MHSQGRQLVLNELKLEVTDDTEVAQEQANEIQG